MKCATKAQVATVLEPSFENAFRVTLYFLPLERNR